MSENQPKQVTINGQSYTVHLTCNKCDGSDGMHQRDCRCAHGVWRAVECADCSENQLEVPERIWVSNASLRRSLRDSVGNFYPNFSGDASRFDLTEYVSADLLQQPATSEPDCPACGAHAAFFATTSADKCSECGGPMELQQVCEHCGNRIATGADAGDQRRAEERLDRAWIAGARFGWNCGDAGNITKLNDAIRARLDDIAAAATPPTNVADETQHERKPV